MEFNKKYRKALKDNKTLHKHIITLEEQNKRLIQRDPDYLRIRVVDYEALRREVYDKDLRIAYLTDKLNEEQCVFSSEEVQVGAVEVLEDPKSTAHAIKGNFLSHNRKDSCSSQIPLCQLVLGISLEDSLILEGYLSDKGFGKSITLLLEEK